MLASKVAMAGGAPPSSTESTSKSAKSGGDCGRPGAGRCRSSATRSTSATEASDGSSAGSAAATVSSKASAVTDDGSPSTVDRVRLEDIDRALQALGDELLGRGGVHVELLAAVALELAAPAQGRDHAESHEHDRHGDGHGERAGPLARGGDPGDVGHGHSLAP